MKIIHKTTYTVERVTVKEALKRDDWYGFLESTRDTSTSKSPFGVEYLRAKKPRKLIYIVTSNVLRCELVEDAPSCSCPGDMWEGNRVEFLAIALKCTVHAEQYKNARAAK